MSIFCHSFNEMTAEDREVLREYFGGYDYNGASYTFISNYIWRTSFCLSWEIINGYLCLSGSRCSKEDSEAIMSMPLTRDGKYDAAVLRETILECRKRFEAKGLEFSLIAIPGHMRHYLEEAFPGEIEFTHDRDKDEYVYLKEKLITLSGRALHKKKNHLNFFLRNYEYEAKPVTKEMQQDIMDLTSRIKAIKELDPDEVEDLENEYEAISEMLAMLDAPGVYSVAIFIKGRLEAFALGELVSDELAIEHFEKANDDYRGLYQLVCSEFCRALPESVMYVNREEDMGLPNLRQAKEALKPERMEERYTAVFSQR